MGGLGKTTLARLVFNDEAIQKEFQHNAWVYVSDEFDVMRITKAVLESITSGSCNLKELNEVQRKLRETLAGKKFLIVLDDLWNRRYDLWEALKSPFTAGAPGSTIIVTTRNTDLASQMGTVENHELELLSDEDCWSLFKEYAATSPDIDLHSDLESVREKIIEKCRGLPLAAKILGGVLRCKPRNKWEDVLNSNVWHLPENESSILPVFKLSYYHLPPHLKRCFAYCSIFPKGFIFVEKKLVHLWMAEGFVQQSGENKRLEEIGCEYFHELVSRSMFKASSAGELMHELVSRSMFKASSAGEPMHEFVSRSMFQALSAGEPMYVMHDLMNDLAKWAAGETCLLLENLSGPNSQRWIERVRHSSYTRDKFNTIKRFEPLFAAKHLRTFIPSSINYGELRYISYDVLFNLLPKWKRLRVLSLMGYNITELPDSIGELMHLRFLNLAQTRIRSLPESTCFLYNLQFLVLADCYELQKLPSRMENLISLLYLDITNAYQLEEMPKGIKELKSLQTLTNFVLGKNSGLKVNELMNFHGLQVNLCISNLENVIDAWDAREANLSQKQGLDAVMLRWSPEFNVSRQPETEKDVLRWLKPQQKLKALNINCYAGNGFPKWLGDPSFSNLEFLHLVYCRNCIHLPPMGQLSSLKHICIIGMTGVQHIGDEFCGNINSAPFPKLEYLGFEDMEEWENWNVSEATEQVERFPCLRQLVIFKCPKLSGKLPENFPSLEFLTIRDCENLIVSISIAPKLYRLEIEGCKELVFTSAADLRSVNSMVLCKIYTFSCPTEDFLRGLTSVGSLEIGGGCEELILAGLPSKVENLIFRDFERLERLPQALYSLTSLRELSIYRCPSLKYPLNSNLFSTVYKLFIGDCNNLQSCIGDEGEDINLSSTPMYRLEFLNIQSCQSLKCLSRGMLPVSLKYLLVANCSELESIAETFRNLSDLVWLELLHCPRFKSFPEGGLPPTNLSCLEFHDYVELEELPNDVQNFTSLASLWILNCPRIVMAPEELLLTSLKFLCISGLNIHRPLFEWGLHRLTSVTRLHIESFPVVETVMNLLKKMQQSYFCQ